MTFKKKERFPHPVVGKGGDSDTKGATEDGDFDPKKKYVRIPWVFLQGEGPW